MRSGLLVPALALIFTPPLLAQDPSRTHPFVAAGFEAGGVGAAYERAYGLSLQAGYGLQLSRLGIRFDATYFQRNRYQGSRYTSSGYSAPRAIGAALDLTFDLTQSRFRPYLVGGWGVYRLSGSQATTAGKQVWDQVSLALLGGLGLNYRLGRLQLFTEARAHGFTNGQGWASWLMPVTAGIRF
jgi:hypothetical protein